MNTSILESNGIVATTYEDTLKAANLDWTPMFDTVKGAVSGSTLHRKRMLLRSDTQEALGIVGMDYQATSPKEFVRSQFDFAEKTGSKVVRVGWMPDRARAFSFIQLKDQIELPKNIRAKGDPTAVYIYSVDGWDGCTPRRSRLYLERLVCANGMTTRELRAALWVSHTKSLEERLNVRWGSFLNEAHKLTDGIRNDLIQLATTRMTDSEARNFLGKLMPGDSKLTNDRREKVFALFHSEETGNLGQTRYDALNAVTEYVTHHRTYRETDTTSRSTNAFLGVMETDVMRNQALRLLMN